MGLGSDPEDLTALRIASPPYRARCCAGMQANLELKARCADLARARERVRELASAWLGIDEQVDTYFATRTGRLKLRESSLSGAQLIPYFRPDERAAKRSDYLVLAVEDGPGLARMLAAMLGVHCVVRKRREIALYENVRIHLDRVERLGDFVELEAVWDGARTGLAEQQRKLAYLRERLGIRDEDVIAGSYETLLGGESRRDRGERSGSESGTSDSARAGVERD
jgi:predicted adenylyl cyclase CyaB